MKQAAYRKLKVPELKDILLARGFQTENFKGLRKEELILKCVESDVDNVANDSLSEQQPSVNCETGTVYNN